MKDRNFNRTTPSILGRCTPVNTRALGPSGRGLGEWKTRCSADGTVHAKKVDQPFGRISANPLLPELLKEKFVNCALRVLPESNVVELHAAIEKFEQLKDVRELTSLTAPCQ